MAKMVSFKARLKTQKNSGEAWLNSQTRQEKATKMKNLENYDSFLESNVLASMFWAAIV